MSVWQSLVWSSFYRSQGCTPVSDTEDRYEVSRSFQRGSKSRAASRKVDSSESCTPVNNTGDRYEVNRSFQRGSESRAVEYQPTLPFNKHYTDISLCLDSFLRCTPAM